MRGFRWHDGERVIRFGRGALEDAPELLGDGYVLLTTPRAEAAAPEVAQRAGMVAHVPPGRVEDVAGDLHAALDIPAGALLVALGGGRVVDTAKALHAAGRGRGVAAIPTTLSAAEMTRIHRAARGAPAPSVFARPGIVLNDPALSASQPERALAASAANALGHAVEAPLTVRSSPVPALAAAEATRLIAAAWPPDDDDAGPDRDALALGALLSGHALDATGLGLHHVLAQSLVRAAGLSHGAANAAVLPHSIEALRRRALGPVPDAAAPAAAALARRAGATSLRALGVTDETLEASVAAALQRERQMANTPPAPAADEIRALYRAAL